MKRAYFAEAWNVPTGPSNTMDCDCHEFATFLASNSSRGVLMAGHPGDWISEPDPLFY